MHVELLVEDQSTEAALSLLLPMILGDRATWCIHAHRGKRDLIEKLPNRLRGYAAWLPDDYSIVVLVDGDGADCLILKSHLDGAARDAGLTTRPVCKSYRRIQVLNRIAIEELEAWFFGDVTALCAAFPGIPESLGRRAPYRNPDAIGGGTWEALERELQKAGYYRTGLAKIEASRSIARHMDPNRNRSRSFQHFRDGLRLLAQIPLAADPSDEGAARRPGAGGDR